VNPADDILRTVVNPLPAPLERAWRAYDRLQDLAVYLMRHHPPVVDVATQKLRHDILAAAMSDTEPDWPSADGVLAARNAHEAHKEFELAVHGARAGAQHRVGRAIVACESQLCESLDDALGQLQDESALRKAAAAVPLGVGGDGLLAAGPDTASQASRLGEALGRYERIKSARRVIFDYVHPQTAPWMDVVAEGIEDGPAAGTGLIWKSEFVHLASGAEPDPWAGGVGGELHYAMVNRIRLRIMTAAQLDAAGYQPPGIYFQEPIRM
jgi:hypothetical protein